MYYRPDYEPLESDLISLLYIEPLTDPITAAEKIAAESSIGTWTDVLTLTEDIRRRLAAKVFKIEKHLEGYLVWIAYPYELFEEENICCVLSSIAGNIFGMKGFTALRLLDVRFPKEIVEKYPGPHYGIEGIRKYLGTDRSGRPHVGTIVKPKVGLDPKRFSEVAYEAWVGGVDLVKDDENLASQDFCTFEERVSRTLEMKDKAEEETGEKKIYTPNITADIDTMLERLDLVKEMGNNAVMVDVVIAGFSAVYKIRKEAEKYNMFIHGHRAMHAAIDRGKFGMSFFVLSKIYRILGVDQLHAGTAVGKMEGDVPTIKRIYTILREDAVEEDMSVLSLEQKFYGLKPTLPVASGGLHPGHIPKLVELYGTDILIQAGGGIHGHPDGTRAGATAMRQAIEAVMQGISLEEYAKDHEELRKALEKWGIQK